MEDLRTERKGRILAVRDLPTLPKVLEEVSKLVERPDTTTEEVAKLISMDQVLSAKVLKMVNSPVYGFPGRISSIQHALVLLGFNILRSIIVSTSVFEVMTRTRAPRPARAAPRDKAVVVLPTPPFWLAMANTRAMRGQSQYQIDTGFTFINNRRI